MQEERFQKEMGQRIMRLRESYGFTREEFAEQLGISWQHLGNIEKGSRGTPLPLLLHLRELLNVSADYLIYGVEEENDISDISAMLAGADEAIYPYVKESVVAVMKVWNHRKGNTEI